MTVFVVLLIMLLLASVACCAYEFAEARRWRTSAAEASAEAARLRAEMEQAKQVAMQKEAESAKNRELAEAQWKLLMQIQHIMQPIHESLRRFEEQVQAVEKARTGAYEGVLAQVRGLTELQERVRQSVDQLKNALRSPVQRGRWGEIQLRRIVEFAGMLEYCDFAEQATLFGDAAQRPDLIVRLPNECQVVVDAKVSLDAYLRALETEEEAERARLLAAHADQVRRHIKALADKAYWRRLPCSPEFVVAFLPLES